MTPVQTSRRVCVRTSHSPVSLTRSLSLPHTLSAHTLTHAEVPERNWELTGESLGSLRGGHLPSIAARRVSRPYTSPLPRTPVLAFSQSWGSGHRSASARRPEM